MAYYCLAVQSGSELRNIRILKTLVKNELGDDSLQAIFPVREMQDKKGGIFIKVDQPMIPGYIMIHSDKDLGYIDRRVRGMSPTSYGLLRYSDGTYQLRSRDLEYATWVFSFDGRISASRIKVIKNLKEGDKIVVLSGPLRDFKGKIVKLNKNNRVVVEVEFLGDIKTINIPIEIVNSDHSVEKSVDTATQILSESC